MVFRNCGTFGISHRVGFFRELFVCAKAHTGAILRIGIRSLETPQMKNKETAESWRTTPFRWQGCADLHGKCMRMCMYKMIYQLCIMCMQNYGLV